MPEADLQNYEQGLKQLHEEGQTFLGSVKIKLEISIISAVNKRRASEFKNKQLCEWVSATRNHASHDLAYLISMSEADLLKYQRGLRRFHPEEKTHLSWIAHRLEFCRHWKDYEKKCL